MRTSGKPRMRILQLKNGFYIEVCAKGLKTGVKIRSESKNEMVKAANMYSLYKDVIVLGEYKNGVPLLNTLAA
jgi:hypothetical protein